MTATQAQRPLDLRLLASFMAVAEELSFTRAAQRLHMTQPPLSLQIKQLETQLGLQLFERSKRSVRLTPAGETLRSEAGHLFDAEARARKRVARVGRGEEGGHLALGCTPVAALHLVPALLQAFEAQAPGTLYSLHEMHSDAQTAGLLANDIDVALVRPPVVDARLSAVCLWREPQVLALPADHPLCTRQRLQARHLHGLPLVGHQRRSGRYVHDLFMRWLSQHDVVPSRLHDVVHHNALMAVVSAGLALGIVPASAASRPIPGVAFKRFAAASAPPSVELWIASRKAPANPLAQRFIDLAVDFCRAKRSRRK